MLFHLVADRYLWSWRRSALLAERLRCSLHAWQCNSAPLFHTGWFVDSLATQILVIFSIRTANPLQDRPHPLLVASSFLALTLAVALPYSSLAFCFGFVPVPALLMGALSVVAMAYFSIEAVLREGI